MGLFNQSRCKAPTGTGTIPDAGLKTYSMPKNVFKARQAKRPNKGQAQTPPQAPNGSQLSRDEIGIRATSAATRYGACIVP